MGILFVNQSLKYNIVVLIVRIEKKNTYGILNSEVWMDIMIKWKVNKRNYCLVEPNMDILERINYLTRDKTHYCDQRDFVALTKEQYIEYVLEVVEAINV